MSASLPPRPSIEWLRKTAKDRLVELRATRPDAMLADAQLAVAREHGFASWRKLKAHVERLVAAPATPWSEGAAEAFLEAVAAGRIDEVRAALDAAPELLNSPGPHPYWGGRPQPLHVAIENGRRDVFDLLLERGADVNGSNEAYDRWSPLMLAADQPEVRDELIRRGARVGLPEALMLADDARVEELLRGGALPGVVPNDGSILAFARTPFAVDRLLALGARPDQRDHWGFTPIDALSRLGPRGEALVQRIVAHGAAVEPSAYARLGDTTTLARLVESDQDIARDDAVLMAAVDGRHHALVAWLLERGANVNARDRLLARHTALHAAAWNGDLKMVELLVEAGADVGALDEQYAATPAGWAETAIEVTRNPACAEVVAYLRR